MSQGDFELLQKGRPMLRFATLALAQQFFDQQRFNAGVKTGAAVRGPAGERWHCGPSRTAYWTREGETLFTGDEPAARRAPHHDGDRIVLDLDLRRETAAAFLVSDGVTEAWLPKSQTEHDPRERTFAMPEWLAKDKGLI